MISYFRLRSDTQQRDTSTGTSSSLRRVPSYRSGSGRAAAPSWACLEQARDRGGASAASAIPGKPPSGDVIPISADDPITTARAVRALARLVIDIPGIDEMQPDLARDIASDGQREGRRTGLIQHLVVRMEGGEMQGHVRPQPRHHPFAQPFHLVWAVIVTRDQQRCDLEPDLRLFQILECLEDGAEMAGAQPLVELLGERLEVDIGGVHEGVKLLPRRRVNVAGSD